MRRKPFRIIALASVLVLLGLGGVWWNHSGVAAAAAGGGSTATGVPSPAPPVSVAGAPSGKDPTGARAWVAGMLYRYAASADLKVSFGRSPGQGKDATHPAGMHFSLRGEWEVGVVSVNAEAIKLRVHLKPSVFELSVEEQSAIAPDARQAMMAILAMPFFVTLDKAGAVTLTHFEQGVDELARGLLRTLVASSQFVVRGVPPATWQSEEYDTSGRYLADYQRLPANRFEKRKKTYGAVATPQGLLPVGSDLRLSVGGVTNIELGEDLWPQSLNGRERLTVDSGEGVPTVTNELELSLRLLERRMDPSLSNAFAAREPFLSTAMLASFQGQATDPLAHHRQVLGNRSLDDILKELRALPEDEKARDDARTRALEQLRALFMLRPAEALKVPDLLRSGLTPLAASPLLGALSAASTPEAIRSLVVASGDTALESDVRMDAVSALGSAGEPNREGVDALRTLAQDPDPKLRGTATLAFGNAAYQMGDTDARGSDALVEELKNNYRGARSPEQQSLILRSLGNTRAPSALQTLTDALRSESPQVRESALVALRAIPGPEADRLLAERLLSDTVSEVRRSAVFSCGFRPLAPLLPALGQALRKDSSDGVRADIVQLLGQVRGSVPDAMALLRWASQNERHPEIRRMATVFVDTPTGAVPSQPGSDLIR
ncbi:HEAT repeat domain-containing protein [Corallococcus silvisoli]|uniref:HEAT repeat domain-containing protein n=1 Tax=Corallococcus silvisoli TaxID=2697031 RepID=UPI001377263D|nr:HEAT repeat domain-containing protein [Corallococcus silvisoli]NBD14308.1 HEAT repeat domain-containing protein [Corallococcus silvisoli]